MKKRFRALLHGENFELAVDEGGPSKVNFYATRFVDAADAPAAKASALDRLWSDPQIVARQNSEGDAAEIEVVEIEEVTWFARKLRPMRGFTYYEDIIEHASIADSEKSPRELAYEIEKEAGAARRR